MISRREVLGASLALAATASLRAATSKMALCMHQNSSLNIGYRQALEGWARAGIKYAELAGQPLDDFLKTETVAAGVMRQAGVL
jgi:hypothetical protein